MRTLCSAALFALAAACASHPQPTRQLAASMAATRFAQQAGAQRVPEAAAHLKLAEAQLEQAMKMLRHGENERAEGLTIRATSDAELARAIARAEGERQRLAAREARALSTDAEASAPTAGEARVIPYSDAVEARRLP